jgi:hypothetical protein
MEGKILTALVDKREVDLVDHVQYLVPEHIELLH